MLPFLAGPSRFGKSTQTTRLRDYNGYCYKKCNRVMIKALLSYAVPSNSSKSFQCYHIKMSKIMHTLFVEVHAVYVGVY